MTPSSLNNLTDAEKRVRIAVAACDHCHQIPFIEEKDGRFRVRCADIDCACMGWAESAEETAFYWNRNIEEWHFIRTAMRPERKCRIADREFALG